MSGNVINPATSGGMSVRQMQQMRQNQAVKAAVHTGAAGVKGKEEAKTKDPADVLAGVRSFKRHANGVKETQFEDGSIQYKAPNGSQKDIDPAGNATIGLPNGMLIESNEDGSKVYDPKTGAYNPAGVQQEEDGTLNFVFEDKSRNQWKFDIENMSFEIESPGKALTQKVATDGSMSIKSSDTSRNAESGKYQKEQAQVLIDPQGNVSTSEVNVSGLAVNNKGMAYDRSNGFKNRVDFPYQPPQQLQGDAVRRELPKPSAAPPPPPQTSPTDSFASVMPQDPWSQPTPFQGPPGMQQPQMQDPYAPEMTPSGLIRKSEPDGSMFMSLTNGIVVSHRPDGVAEAFDTNSAGQPMPVKIDQVMNRQGQPENRYSFNDSQGNRYMMYSKSPNFSVTSPDGNVMQTVDADGTMRLNARTYPPDQNGNPTAKNHAMMLTNTGQLNTFGEQGVQMGHKNVVFAENGHITNYKLPYEVPQDQSWMHSYPHLGKQGQIPVQDPMTPNQPPMPEGGGFPQQAGGGVFPNQTGEPVYPDQMMQGGQQPRPQQPGMQPEKPGIWQRTKEFFTGEPSNPTNNYTNYNQQCYNQGCCQPYPAGYYDPYAGMGAGMGMGTAMLTGAAVGTGLGLLSSALMWPCGMFCSPFSMFGAGCWF